MILIESESKKNIEKIPYTTLQDNKKSIVITPAAALRQHLFLDKSTRVCAPIEKPSTTLGSGRCAA